jgi:hypothetical protein
MAKTTLTVDIEYDPELTDPEGLASAMDRLLETALSTPGIMEEYGDPRIGEFLVAEPAGSDLQHYTLRIDGPLLRKQRQALLDVVHPKLSGETRKLIEGVSELLDEIADQAHDRYGLASLLEEDAPEEPEHTGS